MYADPVTVKVVGSTHAAAIGSHLTADVVISGLDMSPHSLGAFDLNLNYNATILQVVGVVFGTQLGNPAAAPPEAVTGTNQAGGSLSAFAVSLLPPGTLVANQPDSFPLFTVTFKVIGDGNTSLNVSQNAPLGDENGDPLAGTAQGAPFQGVPIVPTLSQWGLLLLLSGLAAAGLYRLWNRRALRS